MKLLNRSLGWAAGTTAMFLVSSVFIAFGGEPEATKPTQDEIYGSCIEIGHTKKHDSQRRIQILRELGVPAVKLETTLFWIEVHAMLTEEFPSKCAEVIQTVISEED